MSPVIMLKSQCAWIDMLKSQCAWIDGKACQAGLWCQTIPAAETVTCFRLQFETADDQDFIAIQNAIEEVISELQKLPGLSYLEEVRVQYCNFGGRVWMMSCEWKPARSC